MIQLSLFQSHIIKHAELVSPDSPRRHFIRCGLKRSGENTKFGKKAAA